MRKHASLILAAMALSLGAAPAVFCGEPMAVYAAARLDVPDNTGWDDDNECIAIWDEVEGAKQYEVYLYKESEDSDSRSKIAEVKVKKNKYNFKKKMTSEGDYSFRVRALAGKASGDSAWSDYSESTWISSSRATFNDTKGNKDTSATGPGVTKKEEGGATSDTDSGTGLSVSSFIYGWQNDANGWWWKNDDGMSYPVNCWRWLDGNRDGVAECYYFGGNGYMLSDTVTPDGYHVNRDGAWVEPDGLVHTMQSK